MTFKQTGKIISAAILAAAIALPFCADQTANAESGSGVFLAAKKDREHKMKNWKDRGDSHKKFDREERLKGERRDFERRGERDRRDQFGHDRRPDEHMGDRPGQMGRPDNMPPHNRPGTGRPGFNGAPDHNPLHNPGGMRPEGQGFPGTRPGNPPMPPQGMHPGAR